MVKEAIYECDRKHKVKGHEGEPPKACVHFQPGMGPCEAKIKSKPIKVFQDPQRRPEDPAKAW